MFKVGDLVELNASFSLDNHPPMGTLGVVTSVEDWDWGSFTDSNCESATLQGHDQLICVHWSCGPNKPTQVYVDSSLKKVA
ncbi:MAG: hypothetical protein ACXADH_16190 [Candidatus Kariarchaeaceae archaeon]|jgi:hypothetical protein